MRQAVVLFILVILGKINCDESACKSENSCVALYSPICAFNGKVYKTFSSKCELNVHNKCDKNDVFTYKNDGECRKKRPKSERDCKAACSQKNTDPVCALSQKEHKTFPSECDLNRYNCLNPEDVYEIKTQGVCGVLEGFKCDHYCPLQYEPICAFNGKTHKTFTNDCYLSRFNCLEEENFEHRFNGSCWNFETDCSFACAADYNPICAFDGVLHKTFNNECALKTYNCPRNIFVMQKKFNGECGDAFEAKKCDQVCGSQNRSNVCGCNRQHCDDFASECELRKYNCDHDYALKDILEGSCKGAKGLNFV